MDINNEKMIVRRLLRVSSKQQIDADGDLSTQRKLVDDYINTHKEWILDEVKPEYYEGGISGYKNAVASREALQEILKDAKNKEFQILVCYKDDRLGRREDEIPQYIKELFGYGVLVYTAKDGCITPFTHEDGLLTYIRYWMAEGSSRTTGLRVKDAAMELVRKGKNQGGSAPFGYELIYSGELSKHGRALKKKVIVESTAKLVREMYDLAIINGYGSYKIAKILNEDEDKRKMSPNGITWKSETVRDILRNPIYTGYEAYNRRTHTGKEYKRLDREDWVLSEICNEDLKIIDLDKWEKVQQLRENRKEIYNAECERTGNTPISTTGTLALLDVAYCGYCGRKLTNGSKYNYWTTKKGEKKSSIVSYYRCQTKQQAEPCLGKGIYRADNIEPLVFAFVKEYLESLEDNSTVVEKMKETSKKQFSLKKDKIGKLQKHMVETNKDIESLKDNLPKVLRGELPLPAELFYEQIQEKEKKLKVIEQEITLLKESQATEKEETLEVDTFISQIPVWKEVFDKAGTSAKRMIINRLISRIDVKENKITITVRVNLDEFLSRKTIYHAVPK